MSIPYIETLKNDNDTVHWCHQFTIPLLFDDCLSLLQKVCALWAKLNDVITALNKFNDDFNKWASGIESQLSDLYSKYTALESRVTKVEGQISDIYSQLTTLKESLSALTNRVSTLEGKVDTLETVVQSLKNQMDSISNQVSQLRTDLSALESRVSALEELLKNLNIIPPVTVYEASETDFKNTVWADWWAWMKTHLTFKEGAPIGSWEFSPNLYYWDTVTSLPHMFQIGQLAQPVTLIKMPFIAVCKNVITTADVPSLSTIANIAPHFNLNAFTPSDGFFNFKLTKEFGNTMDEVKFQTSYIPFLPAESILFKSFYPTSGSPYIELINNINCGVRVQIPHSGTDGLLCVASDALICGLLPSSDDKSSRHWDLYIYAIAENG